MSADRHSLDRSRWSKRTAQVIDLLCLIALMGVIAVVLYAFAIRSFWANGYSVLLALGILGAITMLLGLAQQAIAARDAMTWRDMAEWQIRAARAKVLGSAERDPRDDSPLDPDSPFYYEHLAEALLDNMRREEDGVTSR